MKKFLAALAIFGVTIPAAAQAPKPAEATFVIKDFKFRSGETLPELKIHYRTFGTLRRDAQGAANNAVLIMHGTGGSGASLVRPEFSD